MCARPIKQLKTSAAAPIKILQDPPKGVSPSQALQVFEALGWHETYRISSDIIDSLGLPSNEGTLWEFAIAGRIVEKRQKLAEAIQHLVHVSTDPKATHDDKSEAGQRVADLQAEISDLQAEDWCRLD